MSKKVVLFLVLPLLIVFMVNRVFFFSPSFAETAGSYLLYPILRLSCAAANPFKTMTQYNRSYDELLAQHNALKEENERLLQENIAFKGTQHFTEQTKELRDFSKRYKLENALLSKIVYKSLTPDEHFIILNRGKADDVKRNMIAIYKFQIIGRVSRVFRHYCKVTLITDKQSKVAVYTNTSNAQGIVEGTNCIDKLELKYISHLKPIENGDLVLSSGQGLIFPEGFCLGKIIDIKTIDLCHSIEIQPLVNIKDIDVCHLTNQTRMILF